VSVIVVDVVNCCSPDDEYVAAGSSDGGVYIWQVATSKLHSVLRDHQSVVFTHIWQLAFLTYHLQVFHIFGAYRVVCPVHVFLDNNF